MIKSFLLIATVTANAAVPMKEVPFIVQDLPKEPPIEGLLGEPGSPSLAEEQGKFADALLSRGLCDVSYFGEEGCKRKSAAMKKRFDVTDLKSKLVRDSEALGGLSE